MDELDKELLREIAKSPGAAIFEVIRPFLLRKSERALRDRIRNLQVRDLIRIKKTRSGVLLFPGRGKIPSSEKEGSS